MGEVELNKSEIVVPAQVITTDSTAVPADQTVTNAEFTVDATAPEIERIPKDLTENTKRRLKLTYLCAKMPELRAAQIVLCRSDIIYWVNIWAATYDPRKTPSTIPFITYPYEDKLLLDLVDSILTQKDILIEKSRDMGVTWCVVLAFTWFWCFKGEGYDFLVGSRKEQYIDQIGNMDTIMEKVRFLIRNMPNWMRPKGFDFKSHSNYLKIVNPETKATITGEATNNNFSRSGRRRAIFFDEFAFWECDEAAWRASSDSTNCRIVVSTPYGFGNQFAKLRWLDPPCMKIETLHWKLHPEKDRAWYENECRRRGNDPVAIAQELDINYEGSADGLLFEIADMKRAIHNQPIASTERIVVVCDPAGQGEDEAVFYVSNNGAIIERKFIATSTDPQLAAEAMLLINKWKAQVFEADSIGNSVCDIVTQLLGKNERGVKVIKFKSSEKAKDPISYFNRRDEVYHLASLAMKSGSLCMDDDFQLQRQLNATKYKKDNGRLYISSKEEVKDVIKRSPDRSDAWVLIPDALSYTHSKKEVYAVNPYRNFNRFDEVQSGEEYGSWGDKLD